jgi:hypothetical protein
MAIILILGVLILIAGVVSTLASLRYLLSGDYEVDQRIHKILRS